MTGLDPPSQRAPGGLEAGQPQLQGLQQLQAVAQQVHHALQVGIQPDMIFCRSDRPIPRELKEKIALFCNVRESAVIQALDVSSIYDVPLAYHHERLDAEVLEGLRANFTGECTEVGMYLAMARQAEREGYRRALEKIQAILTDVL